MKKIYLAISLMMLTFFVASNVQAGDCYADPVYERSGEAVAVISSRVRDGACMEGTSILTILNKGEKAKVIGETDGWLKVRTSAGVEGWVGATLLRVDAMENLDSEPLPYEKIESKAEAKSESKSLPEPLKEASDVAQKLKGFIVLQVESKGEAYYINDDGARIYLKDGEAAYEIMRKLGLGISNENLKKLKKGDSALKKQLKGKILLQVQSAGEAFYVNPKTGEPHYMKDGKAAYEIMRKMGLGISNKDIKKIAKKDISEYKKELKKTKKEKIVKVISEEKDVIAASNGTITLTGVLNDVGATLNWSLGGMTSPKGFKVVVSEQQNPVYPGNEYHYLSDAGARSDSWSGLESGKTYHFRVCEYLGGACGVYSNDLALSL